MHRAVRFAVLSLLLLFMQQQAYVHPIEHLASTGPHPQETALSEPHAVADCIECALLAGGSHAIHGDADEAPASVVVSMAGAATFAWRAADARAWFESRAPPHLQ